MFFMFFCCLLVLLNLVNRSNITDVSWLLFVMFLRIQKNHVTFSSLSHGHLYKQEVEVTSRPVISRHDLKDLEVFFVTQVNNTWNNRVHYIVSWTDYLSSSQKTSVLTIEFYKIDSNYRPQSSLRKLCFYRCLSTMGGSLSRSRRVSVLGLSVQGFSVQGLFVQGVSVQVVSVWRALCAGGLCPGGVSVRGGGLCPGGSLSVQRGVCLGVSIGGVSVQGVSVRENPVQLRAGGKHPTGMHSCLEMKIADTFSCIFYRFYRCCREIDDLRLDQLKVHSSFS